MGQAQTMGFFLYISYVGKFQAREMEDKARRAMLDAAKLAEELRVEQDNAQGLERDRKDLENRAHELQISLDEAEANAIKWGRKMVAKLEGRAKDIEGNCSSYYLLFRASISKSS